MKKLRAMFKNLPPEMRMMIAMAGLVSAGGAIYLLSRMINKIMGTQISDYVLMLIIAGVIALICFLGWLISRVFSRGSRKRGRKMADELSASGTSGPVSMEDRTAAKTNNEKFNDATRRMKKEFGIDVYDLPWYIVIGAPGCGKTWLIDKGGLFHPVPRPEGYKLGTLNYNFWFTSDAVFLDMAGRLVYPQDEADYREWIAFLDTIAKGRKGFPINGALVCVMASHLKTRQADKHEESANIALERLRDLQNRLGVTFATYLVVTKCDQMVGFLQLFDRHSADIRVRDQIFGWSRPGEFTEAYNPERFDEDFDALYARLNELCLHRMHDEVGELDLGDAYTFPAEFLSLREPLRTYINTLFPYIKNPKMIRNLVFRGIYFTSATQTGDLDLTDLKERLGEDVVAHFRSLNEMVKNPKPYFIKELLSKKVFPEHGLVFRNEKQVRRNRKLAKGLIWGSAATFLLLASALGLSYYNFSELMGAPREHVVEAKTEGSDSLTLASLGRTTDLRADVDRLDKARFWPRILSPWEGATGPIEDLQTIQAGLFEKAVLPQAIKDVQNALVDTSLVEPGGPGARPDEALKKNYEAVLRAYLDWLGCGSNLNGIPGFFDPEKDWKALCALVRPHNEESVIFEKDFTSRAKDYFGTVGGSWHSDLGRAPASLLDRDPTATKAEKATARQEAIETVSLAVERLREYYLPFTRINEKHPDPTIREWMRIRGQCETIDEAYNGILGLHPEDIQTLDALETFKTQFGKYFKSLAAAIGECTWKAGPEEGADMVRIKHIREVIADVRAKWVDSIVQLEASYRQCGTSEDERVLAMIGQLQAGDPADPDRLGLDQRLWLGLADAGLVGEVAYKPEKLDKLEEFIEEVDARYGHIIRLVPGQRGGNEALTLTPDGNKVKTTLEQVFKSLNVGLDKKGVEKTPEQWERHITGLMVAAAEKEEEGTWDDLAATWRPKDLAAFDDKNTDLVRRGRMARALAGLQRKLEGVQGETWGLAAMWPEREYLQPADSYYQMDIESDLDEVEKEREEKPEEQPAKRERPRRRSRPEDRARRERSRPTRETARGDRRGAALLTGASRKMLKCARRAFLTELLYQARILRESLDAITQDDYLTGQGGDLPRACDLALAQATDGYLSKYFRAWLNSYNAGEKLDVEEVMKAKDWPEFKRKMKNLEDLKNRNQPPISVQLRCLVAEVLEHVAWAEDDFLGHKDWQEDQRLVQRARGEIWTSRKFPENVANMSSFDVAKPWQMVAADVVQDWKKLVQQISQCGALPEKFEDTSSIERPKQPLTWQPVRRELAAALRDMREIEAIQRVADRGKALLDARIDQILIQRRKDLGMNLAKLPYREKRFETVDAAGFLEFLQEMEVAEECFDNLDVSLPGTLERSAFYERCEDWRRLIGADADEPWKALEVTIKGKVNYQTDRNDYRWTSARDPKAGDTSAPRRSPVNFYYEIHLCLGLARVAPDGKPPDDCIVLDATEDDTSEKLEWRWSSSDEPRVITLTGVDGRDAEFDDGRKHPVIVSSAFDAAGNRNKLWFCAFLHELGEAERGDPRKWCVGLAWDLRVIFAEEAGKNPKFKEPARTIKDITGGRDAAYVGTKLIFTLERPLPEPIPPLKRDASEP